MGIAVRWEDLEKRLLMLTFKGSWTRHDVSAATDKTLTLLKTVQTSVTIVSDFRFASWVGLETPLALLNVLTRAPSHMQRVIFLGVSQIVFSTLSRVSQAASQIDICYANSLSEARQIIAVQQSRPDTSDPLQATSQSAFEPESVSSLKPFEHGLSVRLTSFKGNGCPTASLVPYIVHTNAFYVLMRSDAEEISRVRHNPYVYIQAPGLSLGTQTQIEAVASVIPLHDRPDLIEGWRRKYTPATSGDHWLELVPSQLP
jgi:hypothetical protein